MNVQYISDSSGITTGVVIPIDEWNELKLKYQDIEQDELTVPEWHKNTVRERIQSYNNDPDKVLDFDAALINIEKDL